MGLTPSTHIALSRPPGDLHWKPLWHRHHAASKARLTQHAHPALFCYDVLIEIFAALNLDDKVDLLACARSAQVCLAWTEPASQALWSSCHGWSVKELHHLFRAVDDDIIGTRFLPEGKLGSVRHVLHRRWDDAWALFLYYGSQVRALKNSDYNWWDDPATVKGAERDLIHSLLRRNQGRTFLPSLRTADWDEYPETRGALLCLVPPSLSSLNLTLHSTMTQHDIETFMGQLASTVPALHTLRLTTAPNVSIEHLPYPPYLRHLFLDTKRITLSLAELQTLIARLLQVETLSVRIARCDLLHGDLRMGKALRKLHIEGGPRDLATLIDHLRAPSLRELDINVKDPFGDPSYYPAEHHALSVALGQNPRLSRTLRSLSLVFRPWCSSPEASVPQDPEPPVTLFADVLAPLVQGLMAGLETLVVEHWHQAVHLMNYEVLQVLEAFPCLKRLTLSVGVRAMGVGLCPPSKLPSIAALYNVAQCCQQLEHLEIELADDLKLASQVNGLLVPEQMDDGMLGHPLQTLGLTVWTPVGWRGDGAQDDFQSYANKLFPHRYRDSEIIFVRYPAHLWDS